jgi:sporulation protein YlmC with PRC-barrel domain
MKTNSLLLSTALCCTCTFLPLSGVRAQDSTAKAEASDQQATEKAQSSSANAVSPAHPQRVSEQKLKEQVTKVNRASTFIGMKVKNLQNQELGKVEDLVFDPDSGKIAYAVIGVGGFLGLNDKYIAVPLNAIAAAPGEDHLLLDANRQRLQNAPGFSKDNWPPLSAPAWSAAAGWAAGSKNNAVGRPGRSGEEQGTGSEESVQEHYSGTLSSVDAADHTFKVNGANGEKTFSLDHNALIRTDSNKTAALDDLRVGAKVDVTYDQQGNKSVAKRVNEKKQ